MFKVQNIKNLFNAQRLANENKNGRAFMVKALTRLLRAIKPFVIVTGIFLAVVMGLEVLSHVLPFGEYEDAKRRLVLAISITFYIVCYIKRKSIKAYFQRKYALLKCRTGL